MADASGGADHGIDKILAQIRQIIAVEPEFAKQTGPQPVVPTPSPSPSLQVESVAVQRVAAQPVLQGSMPLTANTPAPVVQPSVVPDGSARLSAPCTSVAVSAQPSDPVALAARPVALDDLSDLIENTPVPVASAPVTQSPMGARLATAVSPTAVPPTAVPPTASTGAHTPSAGVGRPITLEPVPSSAMAAEAGLTRPTGATQVQTVVPALPNAVSPTVSYMSEVSKTAVVATLALPGSVSEELRPAAQARAAPAPPAGPSQSPHATITVKPATAAVPPPSAATPLGAVSVAKTPTDMTPTAVPPATVAPQPVVPSMLAPSKAEPLNPTPLPAHQAQRMSSMAPPVFGVADRGDKAPTSLARLLASGLSLPGMAPPAAPLGHTAVQARSQATQPSLSGTSALGDLAAGLATATPLGSVVAVPQAVAPAPKPAHRAPAGIPPVALPPEVPLASPAVVAPPRAVITVELEEKILDALRPTVRQWLEANAGKFADSTDNK